MSASNIQTCKCCKTDYEAPEMNFYRLCDPCFRQFDNQKMRGRFSQFSKGGPLPQTEFVYTESADVFASWGKCTHDEKISLSQKLTETLNEACSKSPNGAAVDMDAIFK